MPVVRRLLTALLVAAAGSASAQALLLNELVSRNGAGLTDEDGRRPDWVELLNPGTAAVNLAGWGLSDDPAAPFRWRFPERTLAGRGRVLVFLSGLDRTQAATLHAGFRLAGEGGETLVLTRPDGTAADRVAVPQLPRDVSFGRHPDGGGEWKYFAHPTPRAANTSPAFASPVPL
ncbi:MAG TPA: lamin tail domain-containing protein, partial [Verrucomicrobiota bacterium]|nr:lamin tail domain-containing protein [Verrucomicrobiota bacterium]